MNLKKYPTILFFLSLAIQCGWSLYIICCGFGRTSFSVPVAVIHSFYVLYLVQAIIVFVTMTIAYFGGRRRVDRICLSVLTFFIFLFFHFMTFAVPLKRVFVELFESCDSAYLVGKFQLIESRAVAEQCDADKNPPEDGCCSFFYFSPSQAHDRLVRCGALPALLALELAAIKHRDICDGTDPSQKAYFHSSASAL